MLTSSQYQRCADFSDAVEFFDVFADADTLWEKQIFFTTFPLSTTIILQNSSCICSCLHTPHYHCCWQCGHGRECLTA